VIVDGQKIPRLMTPADARHKAEDFRRQFAEVRAAWDSRYSRVTHLKRSGYFLDGPDYSRYMDGVYTWRSVLKARATQTHVGRAKRLAALLADLKTTAARLRT